MKVTGIKLTISGLYLFLFFEIKLSKQWTELEEYILNNFLKSSKSLKHDFLSEFLQGILTPNLFPLNF